MITNKQQQKIDKLLLIYGNKINSYIEQNNYKFSQEYFIKCVVASDPDKQGKSVKWILNNVLNGNILWEDVESGDESKVYDTLSRFYLTRKQFKDQSLRDINQFKRLGDIAEQMRNINIIQSNKELKKDKKEQIYKDTIFLYNQNGYLVVVPKTEEASCFWGLGTEWCTAATRSNNMFNYYNESGPLYICITPDGKKYQFHKNSQPMDENDNPIKNIEDIILKKIALISGGIKHVKDNKNYLMSMDNDFLKYLITKYNYYIRYIEQEKTDIFFDLCLIAFSDIYIIQNLHKFNFNDSEYRRILLELSNELIFITMLDKNSEKYSYLCKILVECSGQNLTFIDKKNVNNYEELCFISVNKSGSNIFHISSDNYSYKLFKTAIKSKNADNYFLNRDDIIISDFNYLKLSLLSVKTNGLLLKNINKEKINNRFVYEKLCKIAVKQNPFAINFINANDIADYQSLVNQTVKETKGKVIQYVDKLNINNYSELCEFAIRNNCSILHLINPTDVFNYKLLCELSILNQSKYIAEVNKEYLTQKEYEELCLISIKKDGSSLKYINYDNVSNYKELFDIAITQNVNNVFYANSKYLTQKEYEELCLISIKKDGSFLNYVKYDNVSNYKELCDIAIAQNVNNVVYVNKNINNYKELKNSIKKNNIQKDIVQYRHTNDIQQYLFLFNAVE